MDVSVSIIVPVYNTKKYLEKCITSIINQTFKSIEIILVNDGSTDDSLSLCRKLEKSDRRIRVFSQKNSGPSCARNFGLQRANGDYILFIDSDDYIESNMVEEMYNIMIRGQYDMVMCNYDIIDGDKVRSKKTKFNGEYLIKDKNVFLEQLYTTDFDIIPSPCNKLYKKDIINSNNIFFDERLSRAEDFWFNFEYLKNVKNVYVINKEFYKYVQNNNSIMHNFGDIDCNRWTETRKKLLVENKKLDFDINYNKFYKGYIYKYILYIKWLLKFKNNEAFFKYTNDQFFINSLYYTEELPYHIRIICYLIKMNQIKLVKLCFFVWNLISK